MKKPILPNQISTEELLDIIKNQKIQDNLPQPKQKLVQTETWESSDIYLSFVMAFNLIPGEHLVHYKVLYALFKQWNNNDNISLRVFLSNFAKYLPYKLISHKKHFCINASAVNLSIILEKEKSKKQVNVVSKLVENRIVKWLKDCKLEKGSIFVERDILYHLFDTWCYNRNLSPSVKKSFTYVCTKHLNKKLLSKNTIPWFGVNEEVYNCLNEETVKNWRHGSEKKTNYKDHSIPRKYRDQAIYPQLFDEMQKLKDENKDKKRKIYLEEIRKIRQSVKEKREFKRNKNLPRFRS